MTPVAIPHWNPLGLLPPIDPEKPTSPVRSPYPISLADLVRRFATSPERREILSGFLGYRSTLHAAGLTVGFQWLDGSFLEDVERLEARAPRDLDVVTFAHAPTTLVPAADARALLNRSAVKARYHVDSYLVGLDELPPRELTQSAAYWYSMWSHRRDNAWKGYLQVELSPAEDGEASRCLERIAAGEVP